LLIASLVLLAAGLFASGASGQEKPNPIVAQVRAAVEDANKPFGLLIRFEVKKGAGPKLEAAYVKAVRLTRKEKGCLAYDLSRDATIPNRYLIYERWENVAALATHQKSAHLAEVRRETADLRAGPPVVEILLPVGD
jgi:quinol monooxygenase YgiN